MIIYRCSSCGRIFRGPSPVTLCKCRACGGWLSSIDESRDSNPCSVKRAKEDEVRVCAVGPNIAQDTCRTWGTGGHMNLSGKDIGKESVGKGGPFPTIIPRGATDIINTFQHPHGVKKAFVPSEAQIGIQHQAETVEGPEDVAQGPQEQQIDEGFQNLPAISFVNKLNSNVEQLKNLLTKCKQLEKLTKQIADAASKTTKIMEDPRALRWRGMLSTYPRVLILGGQGTGKSCLAFWLLEILHTRSPCFVYRLPQEGAPSIPPWLGIIHDLNSAPTGSIVLVDEAYLSFFSRESLSRQNRELARILNLARQKNLGLIFVAHEARHIDKNILSCIDTLVIKKPAPLQVELDRSFLRPYLLESQSIFQGKSDASSKSTSYICFSPSGFEGVVENPKPSFWSEKLSHIFASGSVGKEERPARELSKEEKRKRAKKLRDGYGYSYGEIAKDLGVGKTTVYRWLNGGGTKR